MDGREGNETWVTPLRVAFFLFGVVFFLLVSHTVAHGVDALVGQHLPERATGMWYLDEENNIPTWVAGMILAMIGGLLLVIGFLKYQERDRDFRYWLALGLLPLLVSLDEMAQLHEALDNPLSDVNGFSGVLHYGWIVVVTPLVLMLTIPFIPFIVRLPRRTAALLLLGAGTTFFGAVIIEMPEGFWVDSYGDSGLVWFLLTTTQEVLEMTGAVIAFYAVLDYFAGYRPELMVYTRRDRLPLEETVLRVPDDGRLSVQNVRNAPQH